MGQLLKKIGLIAFLTGVCGPAWAGATLNGTYQGELGKVDFRTNASGRVIGQYKLGGACRFDADRPIVDGEFEGKVLVGTVTLCQTGPACDERAYNILGFYNAVDGVLTADVKLEAGCESPALKKSRLVLQLSRDPGGEPASAAAVATQRKLSKKAQEECLDALKKGARYLERRDYLGASHYFGLGLECNDQNWAAHLGVGVAELKRGNLTEALASLERARDLSHAMGQDDAGVFYNLACANARMNDRKSAIKNLQRAMELGWADPAAMSTDPDLQPLREEQEFKQLLDQAWDRQERQRREQQRKEQQKDSAKKGEVL